MFRQVDSFWGLTGAVIVLLAIIMVMSALNCAVADKQGLVNFDADRIERVEAALAKIEAHLRVGDDVQAGHDATVNEPWTARILAIGQALMAPLSIVLYLWLHRWPTIEAACDAIKGKPRQRRTRVEDKR